VTSRQIHRFSAIATSWGNSTHVVGPKSWEGKRVYCLLKEEYDMVRDQMRSQKVEIVPMDDDLQQ